MEPSPTKRSSWRYDPYARSTPSKRKFVRTQRGSIFKATSVSNQDLDQLLSAESLLAMSKREGEPTLKRSTTLRNLKQESPIPNRYDGENSQIKPEAELIWTPSEDIFSLEPPIGNCWKSSPLKWPNTPVLCSWCGMNNCATMCYKTWKFFNPGSAGSGNLPKSLQQSLPDESSCGDGSPSEMWESPISRCTMTQKTPSLSREASTQTSTTPMDINELFSLTGVDVTNRHSPMDWLSNSKTGISLVRSTNPLPRDSKFPT